MRWGLVQVSLAGILWGTGGLGMRIVQDHAPVSVLTVSAWRMVVAAIVLAGVLVAMRRARGVGRLLRERGRHAALVGVSTGAYQALYFGSVVTVGVTVATVVSLGLAPVLLTVGEAVAAGRAPGRRAVLVLVTALTGLVLVSVAGGLSAEGSNPTLGLLLALGSGSAYALTTAVGRPLTHVAEPLVLTTTTTSFGALALLPLGLLSGGAHLTSDPVALSTLVYLGVMTMALAYGLYYAGLRTTPGSSAVVATLLEPVTAAVVAAIVLGERLGVLGVAGTLLILAAVAGLGREPELPPG